MGKKSAYALRAKDLPLMYFIWRWKLATTAALTARFYPDYKWSPRTTYWRLWQLKKRGFVRLVYFGSDRHLAWTLTQAGFNNIRHNLPELKEVGFATENALHDIYVQAAHLGDLLPNHSSPSIFTFTEQELRRIHPGCYPDWVPKNNLHRPDGFWSLPRIDRRELIALEVELSSKTTEQYGQITNFYNSAHEIDGVVWVIASKTLAAKIQTLARKSPFKFRNIHQFVDLGAFLTLGWQAPIFLGTGCGRKLCEFLVKPSSMNGPWNSLGTPMAPWSLTILDGSLFDVKSAVSPKTQEHSELLLSSPIRQVVLPKTN